MSKKSEEEKLAKMNSNLDELDRQIDEMLIKRGLKPMNRGDKAGTIAVSFIKKGK